MLTKRILSLLLSLFLTAVCCSSALAADAPANSPGNALSRAKTASAASVRYSYTSSVTASLSFDGNTAYCKGSVTPSGSYEFLSTGSKDIYYLDNSWKVQDATYHSV